MKSNIFTILIFLGACSAFSADKYKCQYLLANSELNPEPAMLQLLDGSDNETVLRLRHLNSTNSAARESFGVLADALSRFQSFNAKVQIIKNPTKIYSSEEFDERLYTVLREQLRILSYLRPEETLPSYITEHFAMMLAAATKTNARDWSLKLSFILNSWAGQLAHGYYESVTALIHDPLNYIEIERHIADGQQTENIPLYWVSDLSLLDDWRASINFKGVDVRGLTSSDPIKQKLALLYTLATKPKDAHTQLAIGKLIANSDPQISRYAAKSLKAAPPQDPRVKSLLTSFLTSENIATKIAAAEILSQSGKLPLETQIALAKNTAHSDRYVIWAAGTALTKNPPKDPSVISIVLNNLKSPDPIIKRAAIDILASTPASRREILYALVDELQDPNYQTRKSLIRALKTFSITDELIHIKLIRAIKDDARGF